MNVVSKQNKNDYDFIVLIFKKFTWFGFNFLSLSTFVNETLRNNQDPILPPLKTLKMRVITPLSFLT